MGWFGFGKKKAGNGTTTMMAAGPTWTVDCAPECGFMVQDHNKDELVAITQTHMKLTHSKAATAAEVLKMAKQNPA